MSSGLGLSLARQIVASAGGQLWYEDRDGGGARFVIELPDAAERGCRSQCWLLPEPLQPPTTTHRYVRRSRLARGLGVCTLERTRPLLHLAGCTYLATSKRATRAKWR